MNLLADYSFLPAAYNCPDLAGVVGYVAYFSSAAGTCIQVAPIQASIYPHLAPIYPPRVPASRYPLCRPLSILI